MKVTTKSALRYGLVSTKKYVTAPPKRHLNIIAGVTCEPYDPRKFVSERAITKSEQGLFKELFVGFIDALNHNLRCTKEVILNRAVENGKVIRPNDELKPGISLAMSLVGAEAMFLHGGFLSGLLLLGLSLKTFDKHALDGKLGEATTINKENIKKVCKKMTALIKR